MTDLAERLVPDRSVRTAVSTAVDAWGGLDVLVNSAGIVAQGGIADNSDEAWHRVWDINVVGRARVARAALPPLRTSAHAAVVDIASIAAAAGLPQRALYSAGKGAVLSLTRAMAAGLLADCIRVNTVSPGTADTPWVNRLLDRAPDPAAEYAARQPHGRLVSADEVAAAVAGRMPTTAPLRTQGQPLPTQASVRRLVTGRAALRTA